MANKIKIILLSISIIVLFFSINIAIKNYQIRQSLKQTYDALKHNAAPINEEKVIELNSYFFGNSVPISQNHYSINEIGASLKNGFSYFTGIDVNEKKINYSIVVYDKDKDIRKYYSLKSIDCSNSHFILTYNP